MPNKMLINIVGGRGIMGQLHKPLFEKQGHSVIISGRESNPSIEEASEQADLTIISVPIDVTLDVIKKVAPYCKAIMDFTSLKDFAIKAMLKYSNLGCEVAGLHPLYGGVDSIAGRNIVYCPTERSSEKCKEIVKCLEAEGANIIPLSPEEHDRARAYLQNTRKDILESFAALLEKSGISIETAYHLASPPVRIMLDLVARQANPENDELFKTMREMNSFNDAAEKDFLKAFGEVSSGRYTPEDIRKYLGKELDPAQERARKLV